MSYRWGDFHFDEKGAVLTRAGQPVDVSRKVLFCIRHLLEHRNRVVSYDELSRTLWGHDNVTNHQLTQVVVAARRAVGDDGQTQGVIRTISGLGYHWIQPVTEESAQIVSTASDSPLGQAETGAESLPQATSTQIESAGDEAALQPPPPSPLRSQSIGSLRRRGLLLMLGLLCAAVVSGIYVRFAQERSTNDPIFATDPAPSDDVDDVSIDALRKALYLGQHERVSLELSQLPEKIADSPNARLLEIELDIERGRFERARGNIAQQLTRPEASADTLFKAKLLLLQSESHNKAGDSAAKVFPPAEAAIKLLESSGTSTDPETLGLALSARGVGLLIANDLNPALRDLVRAQELLLAAGNLRNATLTQRYMAHAWLRMGRMTDALDQMVAVADKFHELNDPVNEMGTRNMATRIQVEQLRWDEALAGSERNLRTSKKVSGTLRRSGALQLRALVLMDTGRLTEAASLLEEASGLNVNLRSPAIHANLSIAAGRADKALREATSAFEYYGENDRLNLNLESREGALLQWTIAAHELVAGGQPMPQLSEAQLSILRNPESNIGRIARGRWLWLQGQSNAAEKELRTALTQLRAPGWLSETLYANEALIPLLLEKGDVASADTALTEMWAQNPARFERDYLSNVLALRVALALGDSQRIQSAYLRTRSLAGERSLPKNVAQAYAAWVKNRENAPQQAGSKRQDQAIENRAKRQ